MIRSLANLLGLGLLLALTLFAGLYWGLATGSGARWLVHQARLWVPDFSVARVEGALLGRLVLQGVDYRNATDRLHLDRLVLELNPAALRHGVLHIRALELFGPQYASTDDSPVDWSSLKPPLDVLIERLRVSDASLKPAGSAAPLRVNRLDAALALTREGLDIRRIAWELPEFTGELSGHAGLQGDRPVQFKTTWNWHPPGRPVWQGQGEVGGGLDRMTIQQQLRTPLPAKLSAVLLRPLDALQWTAQLEVPAAPARLFNPAWPAWPVTLNLRGEGTGESARASGTFLLGGLAAGPLRGEIQANLRKPGELTLERLAATLPGTQTAIQLSGTLKGLDRQPAIKAVAQWDNLVWPLDGQPEWRSQRGKLSVTGTREALQVAGEGLLEGQRVTLDGGLGFPAERIELRGVRAQGAGLKLQLDGVFGPQLDLTWAVQGDALGAWFPGARGQLQSQGRLKGPRNRPSGEAQLSARDFKLGDASAQALALQVRGGFTPGAPPLEVRMTAHELRYTDNAARDLKLGFTGGVVFRDGRWRLESATAELKLSGQGLRYGDNVLDAIEAEAQGGLLPGSPPVTGRIVAQGLRSGGAEAGELTLALAGGLVQQPDRVVLQGAPLALRLEVDRFAQGNRQARDLRFNVVAGGAPDSPVSLSLQVPELRLADDRLSLELEGRGALSRHSLTGEITGQALKRRPASLKFRAEGGWAAETWTGAIRQFDGVLGGQDDWRLNHPALLRLGRNGGELGLACWESQEAEACLKGKLGALGGWETAMRINGLKLERLQPWLPAGLLLKGTLDAGLQLAGQGDRLADGQGEASVTSALIERRSSTSSFGFRPVPLALRGLVNGRGAELRLIAEQAGFAALRVGLDLDGPLVLSRWQHIPTSGDAVLDVPNVGVLMPLLTDIEKLYGRLDAGVRVAGTPASPRLQVRGTLFDGGFSVPRLGIKVRSLNADVISHDNNQLAMTGRGVSGNGEIRLDGLAMLSPEEDWPLSLTLRGKRFLAADIPEAKVWLSPDLRIEHKDSCLSLTGKLAIPEARITIPDESGAIKPSRDVLIVQGDEPPEARSNPLESRVEVTLGDKIQVTGPGYRARVDGQVTIEQSPGRDAQGTGEIKIHDGQYSLYGVDLEVNGGRLVFSRSPMDNPNLDIRAVRKTDDVVAGAKLLGTLNKPNITLFADRPMSQTDILAYILTGKTFDPLAQQDGSAIRGAASALGGSAGSVLAKELSSRLGLGGFVDISMQGSLNEGGIAQAYGGSGPWGSTQGTALFLGKYLTPKIYVQYGMGLFQNAYVFRLRYDLTQRWKIQTETGEFSGGDILYQWQN